MAQNREQALLHSPSPSAVNSFAHRVSPPADQRLQARRKARGKSTVPDLECHGFVLAQRKIPCEIGKGCAHAAPHSGAAVTNASGLRSASAFTCSCLSVSVKALELRTHHCHLLLPTPGCWPFPVVCHRRGAQRPPPPARVCLTHLHLAQPWAPGVPSQH